MTHQRFLHLFFPHSQFLTQVLDMAFCSRSWYPLSTCQGSRHLCSTCWIHGTLACLFSNLWTLHIFQRHKNYLPGSRTAWLESSNSRISLRKFQAFSLLLVLAAHKKSWDHSRENAFSFHIQDRNMLVNIYKNMTAVSLDCSILITTGKASLPEYTFFMIVAHATQLYNCVIFGQALHRFSNMWNRLGEKSKGIHLHSVPVT